MGLITYIKETLFPSLSDSLKVKVSDIEGIMDGMDRNDDGYISANELIAWIKELRVKI